MVNDQLNEQKSKYQKISRELSETNKKMTELNETVTRLQTALKAKI